MHSRATMASLWLCSDSGRQYQRPIVPNKLTPFLDSYSPPNTCLIRQVTIISHYGDVIMGAIASQITSLTIVYSIVYSDADQRKHQSSVSLAFVRGIHRGPVNSPHKWPVTWKMFPFDDVIMICHHDLTKKAFSKLKYTYLQSVKQWVWHQKCKNRFPNKHVIHHEHCVPEAIQ